MPVEEDGVGETISFLRCKTFHRLLDAAMKHKMTRRRSLAAGAASTGLYFCILEVGGFHETRKMVLVK